MKFKLDKTKSVWIITGIAAIVLIAIVIAYTVLPTTAGTTTLDKVKNLFGGAFGIDRGKNGYWNEAKQQCWPEPNSPNPTHVDKSGVGMGTCCFDMEKYQVDCSNDKKRLSNNPVLFEIYSYPGQAGIPGRFSAIAHRIDISNTGTVDIDKVWVDSANWTATPSNTNVGRVNGNYTQIVGTAVGQAVAAGTAVSFYPGAFYLTGLDTGTGTSYNLTMIVKATTYAGSLNSTITYTDKWFKVIKETIGISVSMTY